MRPFLTIFILASTLGAALCGCQEALVRHTDRQTYDVIHDRQRAALGMTTDVYLGDETGRLNRSDRMYSFNPRPIDSKLPEEFQTTRPPLEGAPTDIAHEEIAPISPPPAEPVLPPGQQPVASPPTEPLEGDAAQAGAVDAADQEALEAAAEKLMSPAIHEGLPAGEVVVFGLADTLAFTDRNARELQGAKEELYLQALELTLERHLWTPQFVSEIQTEYANYGQVRDFDQAMTAVSDFAVSQRLPFGGDVTARVVNTLMRDLGVNTTSGESGAFILSANLPLLRGAGRAAYESRYSAEREMIYAVRAFERFRREFFVRIAANYFELQQLKAAVLNTHKSYESRYREWIRSDFINRMGQSRSIFDAPRAKSSFRQAEASLVQSKEQYAAGLDLFKVLIGMEMDTPLEVLDQDADVGGKELEELLPRVDLLTAEAVGLRYRLDLLNTADAVDDAYRGVSVAKNRLLPDLNLSGSATIDSDPVRLNSASFNDERTTWRGLIELRLDDRKAERNAYRAAIIEARRAERDYDEAADTVRAEIRRAVRRIAQQEKLITIQALNVEENEFRLAAAQAQFRLGRITNQDVVDAENDLLDARNDYAAAISAYRNAILQLRLSTGTLRVTDDGQWQKPAGPWLPSPPANP